MILNASNVVVTLTDEPAFACGSAIIEASLHVGVTVKRGTIITDRHDVHGWGLKPTSRKLAERLKRAIEAGAAFEPATIKTDINGKTYVSATPRVFGRRLNADLKRLGF